MKLSFAERQIALRDSFLAHEAQILSNLNNGSFQKIKDWDDQGRTIIWQGVDERTAQRLLPDSNSLPSSLSVQTSGRLPDQTPD